MENGELITNNLDRKNKIKIRKYVRGIVNKQYNPLAKR